MLTQRQGDVIISCLGTIIGLLIVIVWRMK